MSQTRIVGTVEGIPTVLTTTVAVLHGVIVVSVLRAPFTMNGWLKIAKSPVAHVELLQVRI